MRVANTDELAPWMRDLQVRTMRVERKREVPYGMTGAALVGVDTFADIPENLSDRVAYLVGDTGETFVLRDGVLRALRNDETTINGGLTPEL